MAIRLGRTVGELKGQITPSELENWSLFIEWEEYRTDTVEYRYLAQIAATIVAVNSKDPRNVKLENFLLRYMTQDQKDRMLMSKLAHGVPPELLGLSPEPENN